MVRPVRLCHQGRVRMPAIVGGRRGWGQMDDPACEPQLRATLLEATEYADGAADTALDPLLGRAIRAIAAGFGDGCGVHLLVRVGEQDGDEATPSASWHPDPPLAPLVRTLLLAAARPGRDGLVGRVARTGRPLRLNGQTPERLRPFVPPASWSVVARSGIHGALLLPLTAFGRTLGVLTVVRDRIPWDYSAADEALLAEIAERIGGGIDRALLTRAAGQATQMAELDRRTREFTAGISHELRTPLGAVELALGLLADGASGPLPPAARELLDIARRNSRRLTILVEDLLTVHQLDAGMLAIRRAPLDLRDVVADAAAALAPLLEEKGQALDLDLPAPLPVDGDVRRLGQVATNLLANAHRHTPAGTLITAVGTADADAIRLVVGDNGPGVPAGERERIFARHHRREAGGGSGLGLALVRAIVERHGGRVWAEDVPGGGASFHVALPHAGVAPPGPST